MGRKSSETDKKLLKQGLKLLVKKGASKLSIREICDNAGVNLGMFNYYFGSKDKFIEQILSDLYSNFLADLEFDDSYDGIKTLETQLMILARFARDHRHLILVLLNDILNGEKSIQKFAKRKMTKHFIILAKTLRLCQKDGVIIDSSIPFLITHIAGSLGLSSLVPEVLSNLGVNRVFDVGLKTISKSLMSDEMIELRVKITIQGIRRV